MNIWATLLSSLLGYWHQRADERHGNPPQGNQELLVVRDKVGRPPGELGVSKSMERDIFPSVLWHCWLGDRKGIRPIKTGCWFVGGDDLTGLIAYSTYSSSSPVVTTTSIILCFNKHPLIQVHLEMAVKTERLLSSLSDYNNFRQATEIQSPPWFTDAVRKGMQLKSFECCRK